MTSIHILYFAGLAERLDCREENLALPGDCRTVGQLKALLGERGDHWRAQLQAPSTRCALNQQLVNDSAEISAAAEIAFFPPVTGG